MKHQTGGELGHHMAKMGGILDLHKNITGVTRYMSPEPGENALWKQLIFLHNSKLPFPSAQDLATKAAA
jgi:hypothetical protein